MRPKERTQRDSDPLPYVQLDRAVKPKAASLANLLGVSPQHAVGSLIDFGEGCGDPRELEALASQGKTEVVIGSGEVAGRLHVAFGKPVEPNTMRLLGLLEERDGGYRIRGMSRYFDAIRGRLETRAGRIAGGRTRAKAQRDNNGRFVATAATDAGPSGGWRVSSHQLRGQRSAGIFKKYFAGQAREAVALEATESPKPTAAAVRLAL